MSIWATAIRRLFNQPIEPRANVENPHVPLTADNALELFNSSPALSGVRVNKSSVLGIPALWRAVNLIAGDVGRLPLLVYRRTKGGKVRATEHPVYKLLKMQPNQYIGSFSFKQTITAHAIWSGNGYAWIQRGGGMKDPLWMVPLDPEDTYPVRVNGRLYYQSRDGAGTDVLYTPENVLHLKGLADDGFCGHSVIDIMRGTFGEVIATSRYSQVFFKNNAMPKLVIEMPGHLDDERAVQRFRASWLALHGGVENSHKPAILEDGAKVSSFKLNNEDIQFLELRQFGIREIGNITGCPAHKLGDPSRTSYASLESENKAYLQDCLDGWLVRWEQECGRKLLRGEEYSSDSHFCEFVRDALLQADRKSEAEVLERKVNAGLLTLNEGRSIDNQPPLDEEEANIPRMPSNHVLLGQQQPPQEPTQNPAEPADSTGDEEPKNDDGDRMAAILAAHRGVVGDSVGRYFQRISNQATRRLRKPGYLSAWLDDWRRTAACEMAEWILPSVRAVASVRGGIPEQTANRIATTAVRSINDELTKAAESTDVVGNVRGFTETHTAYLSESVIEALITGATTNENRAKNE